MSEPTAGRNKNTSVCVCRYLLYAYIPTYLPTLFVYLFACCLFAHLFIYVYLFVCLLIEMHIYMCIYACIYICIYTCIKQSSVLEPSALEIRNFTARLPFEFWLRTFGDLGLRLLRSPSTKKPKKNPALLIRTKEGRIHIHVYIYKYICRCGAGTRSRSQQIRKPRKFSKFSYWLTNDKSECGHQKQSQSRPGLQQLALNPLLSVPTLPPAALENKRGQEEASGLTSEPLLNVKLAAPISSKETTEDQKLKSEQPEDSQGVAVCSPHFQAFFMFMKGLGQLWNPTVIESNTTLSHTSPTQHKAQVNPQLSLIWSLFGAGGFMGRGGTALYDTAQSPCTTPTVARRSDCRRA